MRAVLLTIGLGIVGLVIHSDFLGGEVSPEGVTIFGVTDPVELFSVEGFGEGTTTPVEVILPELSTPTHCIITDFSASFKRSR